MSWQKIEPTRHRVAVSGVVTDDLSGKSLARATIEITAAPAAFETRLALRRRQHGARWAAMTQRPDRTRTAADGHFHFLDLPAGEYTLTASLPTAGSRYGKTTADFEVALDGLGNTVLAVADLTLPPTTVEGWLTETGSPAAPVAMAEVRVVGSGEHTYSKADGFYSLRGLEKGRRTVRVSARGFQTPPPQIVDLADAGDVASLNLALEPV